jgi:hypothetical protein
VFGVRLDILLLLGVRSMIHVEEGRRRVSIDSVSSPELLSGSSAVRRRLTLTRTVRPKLPSELFGAGDG